MGILNHIFCREEDLANSIADTLSLSLLTEHEARSWLFTAVFLGEILVCEGIGLSNGCKNHLNSNNEIKDNVTSVTREKIERCEDLEQT